MKNKKQCGYLDSKGGFHKTVLECNNSNIENRIRFLRDKIQNLSISYSRRFHQRFKEGEAFNRGEIIERVILELLVGQRDRLLEYSNEIVKLKEEINQLEGIKDLPKIFRKDWWKNEIISF